MVVAEVNSAEPGALASAAVRLTRLLAPVWGLWHPLPGWVGYARVDARARAESERA